MAAVVESSSSSSDAPSTPKAFTPNDFVHSIVGKSVVVKLNSGVAYHGVLACLDGFMNLALEQCEEYVDGQRTKSFGDCFIRGNNGECSFLAFAAPSVCARVLFVLFFFGTIFPFHFEVMFFLTSFSFLFLLLFLSLYLLLLVPHEFTDPQFYHS